MSAHSAIDVGLLRDVLEFQDAGEKISDFYLVCKFEDMENLYPDTFVTLVRILDDWLQVQMPRHLATYGRDRVMSWLMTALEIQAAKLQGREIGPDQWQFRVLFEDVDSFVRYLERNL